MDCKKRREPPLALLYPATEHDVERLLSVNRTGILSIYRIAASGPSEDSE